MNNVESTCEQQGFEILHSVANRVRLRALDTKTKNKLTAIAQHLRSIAGIESVRINQETGSLLITYTQDTISRTQVQQLLEPYGIAQETTSPEPLGADSYNQTLKRLTSFIPPVVGMVAVRGLGIYGWQSFAAYFIASKVTREVMNQFDLPLFEAGINSQSEPKLEQEKEQSRQLDESDYQVIHHIPGRIRLSIKRVKQDLDYVKKLEKLTQWDNRITGVRVNPESGSVIINYRTGTPSNTEKTPLSAAEIITLMELITSDKANLNHKTSLKEILNAQKIPPQNVEEISSEVQENLEEKKALKIETDSTNLLVPESLEEDDSNDRPPSGSENFFSSSSKPSEDSSSEQPINSISSVEQDGTRYELSEDDSENPWRRFKACMLTTMLRFMANFPLQQA